MEVLQSHVNPADPTFKTNRERMEALGYEPLPAQPLPQLAESVRTEFERNAGIVKAFNIQP